MLAPNSLAYPGPQQLLIITCLWLHHVCQGIDVGDITRKQNGDMFVLNGTACSKSACVAYNGTLWRQGNSPAPKANDLVSAASASCSCVCPKDRPLFRDDQETCSNDVSECSVAQYSTGSPTQFIPFIFLPLKGQIIHPSKEISFPGVRTPVCAVSGAQFLTKRGLADLRNAIDADVPFTLFRDEGRTFLQWTGESELRERMVGRLLLVRLLCRDVSISTSSSAGTLDLRGVFTPCVAFRVQGSPVTHITNVSEVIFTPDAQSSDSGARSGLTTSEYVAIGISSVLLGLIYVASIFLYLHLKKRRIRNSIADAEKAKQRRSTVSNITNKQDVIRGHALQERSADINLSGSQEGVVKNNPLLSREHKHFFDRDKTKDFADDNEGNATDSEEPGDCDDSRDRPKKIKMTSVLVHANNHEQLSHLSCLSDIYCSRDETGIERLPEENVSIIETVEGRDDRPEMFRIIGTARKKLYFNPAYFEPHLLQDPPPAAIEFLTKIREVISVAKQKMATKRFQPILREIPEEETYISINLTNEFHHGPSSHRSSNISLKRENTRKRVLCSGCPGCDLIEQQSISDSLLKLSDLVVCENCSSSKGERQNSVRKWLENMPLSDQTLAKINPQSNLITEFSLNPPFYKDNFSSKNGFFVSKSLYNTNKNNFSLKSKPASHSVRSEPSFRCFNFALPSYNDSSNAKEANNFGGFTIAKTEDIRPVTPNFTLRNKALKNDIKVNVTNEVQSIMPDMINEALAIDEENKKSMRRNNSKVSQKIVEKTCIDRLDSLQNNLDNIQNIDYETDSLERITNHQGLSSSSPTDFGELSSSQASPSLSTALPIEEEMTIRNAVYKSNPSSRSSGSPSNDNTNLLPDYEEIGKSTKLKTISEQNKDISKVHSNEDYSLVSEVYVNNDYNFGSSPSSPSGSDSSMGSKKVRIRYDDPEKKPGRLTIEVPNPPVKYLVHSESDSFEPDTLDRKHSKFDATIYTKQDNISTSETKTNIQKTVKVNLPFILNSERKLDRIEKEIFCNSQIINGIRSVKENDRFFLSDLKQNFDKTKDTDYAEENIDYEGRVLTLELRHSKRQRQLTPPHARGLKKAGPPDVVPPLPTVDNIYEQPKPPKRYMGNEQPPLPPKNDFGRSNSPRKIMHTNAGGCGSLDLRLLPVRPSCSLSSASVENSLSSDIHVTDHPPTPPPRHNSNQRAQGTQTGDTISRKVTEPTKEDNGNHKVRIHVKESNTLKRVLKDGKLETNAGAEAVRKPWRKPPGHQQKDDSGYLSSDSSPSQRVVRKKDRHSCSESDSSEYEAQSESGAESIETHSVFFGSLRKLTLMSNTGKNIISQPPI